MKKLHLALLPIIFTWFGLSSYAFAADDTKTHMPFIHAGNVDHPSLYRAADQIKTQLKENGFEIVGEYTPYKTAHIIVVTNEVMKTNAAKSELGAFGAGLRVTLTNEGDKIQVSYSNPVYVSHVYQMKGDFSGVRTSLEKALGFTTEYGPEDGLTGKDLRDYQYKWLMPYFTDTLELVEYSNQKEALEKINAILATKKTGVTKVYEVTLPGKEETVIGVAMSGANNNDCSGDEYIMSRIDFKKLKSTGHLPYEVVVSKGKVYALPAEFRIAINFPDLSMMGSNSFASIMCAPESIKAALLAAVGGSEEDED